MEPFSNLFGGSAENSMTSVEQHVKGPLRPESTSLPPEVWFQLETYDCIQLFVNDLMNSHEEL